MSGPHEVRRTLFPDAEAPPRGHDATPRERVARNPWLVMLWIFAVTLVSLGVWGQAKLFEFQTAPWRGQPPVEDFYVLPVVLGTFAPWFVAIGLMAAAGAVLLHSMRWLRMHA